MSTPILSKWIKVVTTNFNKLLGSNDSNVQKALNTLDQHVHSDINNRLTSAESNITNLDNRVDTLETISTEKTKLFYDIKSVNSYAYRGSIVAYDKMFKPATISDIYIYNSSGASHTIKIYVNSYYIYGVSMSSSDRYKEVHNIGLDLCTGDVVAIYCSGSKPTNECVILVVQGGF